MKEVIEFIDNYLTKNNRSSIDPVEANEILAKAGILKDSVDRPGKPLRDVLRKGKIPHAYQSGGKGTSWTIPHSNKSKQPVVRSEVTTKPIKKAVFKISAPIAETDIPSVSVNSLLNEKNFKPASSIDNLVPNKPGIYCIRISDSSKLPEEFRNALSERKHNILYIGIAKRSLKARLFGQELRAKGHGTFFRSLGAMLGYLPPKGSLLNKINKRNYRFSKDDEHKIINWINMNLIVNWIEFHGNVEDVESVLIPKYLPLLNLDMNPLRLDSIARLRKRCCDVANS